MIAGIKVTFSRMKMEKIIQTVILLGVIGMAVAC